MLRMFEYGILLIECFVSRQNETFLKHYKRYGHHAGEEEDIIMGRLAVVS